MWTIAVYPWRYDTDPPEQLWSAERVHFDIDDGVEWWNDGDKSYMDDFVGYDIDIKNKTIIIYKDETPESVKKKSTNDEEITW